MERKTGQDILIDMVEGEELQSEIANSMHIFVLPIIMTNEEVERRYKKVDIKKFYGLI